MFRIFNVYVPRSVSTLLLIESAIMGLCYWFGGYWLLEFGPEIYFLEDGGWVNMVIVVVSVLAAMYLQDMYSLERGRNRLLVVQQICTAIGAALLVQSVLYYVQPQLTMPRWLMLHGSLASLSLIVVVRLVYAKWSLRALGQRRILFLGSNETVRRIAERIQEMPDLGLLAVGHLEDSKGGQVAGAPWLGGMADLEQVTAEKTPDQIVVGLAERRQKLPIYTLLDLKFKGTWIEEAGQLYEMTHQRVSLMDLRPADLVFSGSVSGSARLLSQTQSLYSWVLALVGAVSLLPVIAMVWVLVRLTSSGPAIYQQVRSGLNGQPFSVYKFRSMRVDAEAKTGAVWATKNDPRVTPLGRWLRLLRLDELPQFWNVLKGDMNLVGPRPERPEFVRTLQEQIPFYRQRLLVKPGLTGWAQINHKYGDTIEDTITKLEYDLYYIKHRSLTLDFYIMFQTVKVMLLQRGAQ